MEVEYFLSALIFVVFTGVLSIVLLTISHYFSFFKINLKLVRIPFIAQSVSNTSAAEILYLGFLFKSYLMIFLVSIVV